MAVSTGIVLDERHKVESSRISPHRPIDLIPRISTWAISATPLMSRALDLLRVLKMIVAEDVFSGFDSSKNTPLGDYEAV